MNLSEIPDLPPHALAVRVGCTLAYSVNNPALILLMVEARPNNHQVILSESLTVERMKSVTSLRDSHGNSVIRTVLEPGLALVTYDAIVAVPRNADLPESAWDDDGRKTSLPLVILRYSLPSRYCESDKLGAFASQLFGDYPKGLATAQAICEWT